MFPTISPRFFWTGNLGHLHLRHGWQPFRVVNEISGSDGWWKTEERSVCCIKKTKTRHPKNNWTCNLFHISNVWKGNSQKQHLSWLLPIGLAYGVSDFIHVYTFSGLKEIQRTSRISDTEDAQRPWNRWSSEMFVFSRSKLMGFLQIVTPSKGKPIVSSNFASASFPKKKIHDSLTSE